MNMRVHAPHPTSWAKAITHQPLQLRRNNKDQQGDRHWKNDNYINHSQGSGYNAQIQTDILGSKFAARLLRIKI